MIRGTSCKGREPAMWGRGVWLEGTGCACSGAHAVPGTNTLPIIKATASVTRSETWATFGGTERGRGCAGYPPKLAQMAFSCGTDCG